VEALQAIMIFRLSWSLMRVQVRCLFTNVAKSITSAVAGFVKLKKTRRVTLQGKSKLTSKLPFRGVAGHLVPRSVCVKIELDSQPNFGTVS